MSACLAGRSSPHQHSDLQIDPNARTDLVRHTGECFELLDDRVQALLDFTLRTQDRVEVASVAHPRGRSRLHQPRLRDLQLLLNIWTMNAVRNHGEERVALLAYRVVVLRVTLCRRQRAESRRRKAASSLDQRRPT